MPPGHARDWRPSKDSSPSTKGQESQPVDRPPEKGPKLAHRRIKPSLMSTPLQRSTRLWTGGRGKQAEGGENQKSSLPQNAEGCGGGWSLYRGRLTEGHELPCWLDQPLGAWRGEGLGNRDFGGKLGRMVQLSLKKGRRTRTTVRISRPGLPERARPHPRPISQGYQVAGPPGELGWSAKLTDHILRICPGLESRDAHSQIGQNRAETGQSRLVVAAQAVQWRPIPAPRCIDGMTEIAEPQTCRSNLAPTTGQKTSRPENIHGKKGTRNDQQKKEGTLSSAKVASISPPPTTPRSVQSSLSTRGRSWGWCPGGWRGRTRGTTACWGARVRHWEPGPWCQQG